MDKFFVGESIILGAETYNAAGELYDPVTSMEIEITRVPPASGAVAKVAMINDEVGKYHFDYTVGAETGVYEVKYTATDGARVTIEKDTFQLE